MGVDNNSEFERFARLEMDGLLRSAVMLTGDRELARDLVQDVLIKAFNHWPKIAAMEYPRAYVRTMLTHAFLSWRRRWSVRHITTSDVLTPPPAADHANTVADQDAVWRQLAELPARQRAVLVLRYYECLTDAEIAATLRCTIGSVRGHASRALAALRLPADDPAERAHLLDLAVPSLALDRTQEIR